jgi:hypothetical protein
MTDWGFVGPVRGEFMGHARRFAVPGVCAALTLLVLAPLLGRGFTLTYDMVFAPRHSLLPDSLGLSPALPRSVPADAVVAFATTVVPGDLLQQLVLAAALFAGPLGAARLVPTGSLGVRVVAALAYGWSAYVAERLFLGHWTYLLAYACLPWIAAAGLAVRRREPKALAALLVACVPAVLTPSGGITAAVLAMVCAGPRALTRTVPVVVVLNAPWWVPAVLRPAGALSTADGVAAFSAHGENWGGTLVSLLGLGGVWNAEVVPDSRGNPVLPLLILAMVAVAVVGLRRLTKEWGTVGPVVLGMVGVVLAALPTVPGGDELLGWTVTHVPGGGLLRDSQKWVAWWALPLALGFALGAGAAARVLRRRAARVALLAAAAVFPVALLPDLAFAGWGRLSAVDYPDDWAHVRAVLASDERPGDVVALPFGAFRQFGWNGNRTQLDPAPRVLPRPTIIDDTLFVDGRAVAGEDPRAAEVRAALDRRADLAPLGVGWVLVEHGTPGRVDPATLAGLTTVYDGDWLTLYRTSGRVGESAAAGPPRVAVLVADGLALATVAGGLLWLALPIGRVMAPCSRPREQHRGQTDWRDRIRTGGRRARHRRGHGGDGGGQSGQGREPGGPGDPEQLG